MNRFSLFARLHTPFSPFANGARILEDAVSRFTVLIERSARPLLAPVLVPALLPALVPVRIRRS